MFGLLLQLKTVFNLIHEGAVKLAIRIFLYIGNDDIHIKKGGGLAPPNQNLIKDELVRRKR